MAIGSIQGKNKFIVAKGESRNSTVAVGGMLVFNKKSVSWFKNPQGIVPLHIRPNLFLILIVIHVFVIQKSNNS